MSSMMKCCVLTTALFLDGLAASASTTDIPNIEESDRRFTWLFLDEIPGSWGISPGSPSGGIRLNAETRLHATVSDSGKVCPALLYVTLERSGQSEYEALINAWNTAKVISSGSLVFYEYIKDESTETRSYWVREHVYDFERLRVKSVSFGPGSYRPDENNHSPKVLDSGIANIVFHFETMTSQSTPLSGNWPETSFTVNGLPLDERAHKSCKAVAP